MSRREKDERIRSIVNTYGKLAIAFSGGADSALLLALAIDTLGPGNVLALTARSCLLKSEDTARAATWLARHNKSQGVVHEFVDLDPLAWPDFVNNPADRCYLCKLEVYRRFQVAAAENGFSVLADGTNSDDMNSARPGLRAIRELGVITPLAAAGMVKEEVRLLSREMGLDTWDQPSASCLATRIPTGLPVTRERMRLIAHLEAGLVDRGFVGCRVRLDKNDSATVIVQVRRKDLSRITGAGEPEDLLDFFSENGMKKVFIDLEGR